MASPSGTNISLGASSTHADPSLWRVLNVTRCDPASSVTTVTVNVLLVPSGRASSIVNFPVEPWSAPSTLSCKVAAKAPESVPTFPTDASFPSAMGMSHPRVPSELTTGWMDSVPDDIVS